MRPLILLAACLLSARPASAADAEPAVAAALGPLKMVGQPDWGRDGYFKLDWSKTVPGRCAGLDAAPGQREIWLLSSDHFKDDRFRLTALSARGDVARESMLETRAKELRVWDTGSRLPLAAVMDEVGVSVFDAKAGKKLFRFVVPATSPSDIAALGRGGGGPVLVASYSYGDYGLQAVDRKGRLAWKTDFLPRAQHLAVARLPGGPVVAAPDGLGKIFLVSPKGRLKDRVLGPGNMDRVAFAGGSRLYGLDSGSGSWTESLSLWSLKPGPEDRRWTQEKALDLGPITATAWVAGRFDGKAGPPQLAVGTDNGWVLVFNDDGSQATRARFRGKISALRALDLNGDGREELVVGVWRTYDEEVFAFSRPAAVSAR